MRGDRDRLGRGRHRRRTRRRAATSSPSSASWSRWSRSTACSRATGGSTRTGCAEPLPRPVPPPSLTGRLGRPGRRGCRGSRCGHAADGTRATPGQRSRARPGVRRARRAAGHRRAAARLPAGPARADGGRGGHDVVGGARRRARASPRRSCARTCRSSARTAGAASGTTSLHLSEQIGGGARADDAAARRHRRHRQPRARAGQLLGVRRARVRGGRAGRRRPGGRRHDRWPGSSCSRRPASHDVVERADATIGVIATPAAVAQDVCDALVAAGVVGILTFAPRALRVPDARGPAGGGRGLRAADPRVPRPPARRHGRLSMRTAGSR